MICWNSEKAARALAETAEAAFQEAQSGCPVRTGKLKSSLARGIFENTAVISANTDYAVFVEFGTGKAAPQPFLQEALAAAAKRVPEIYLREIFDAERSGNG